MKYDIGFRKQTQSYLSSAYCYENIFDEKELDIITNFMFQKTRQHIKSKSGNLFFIGNIDKIFNSNIKHKLENYLDVSPITRINGNFFHTPHEYGIHTDMPKIRESKELYGQDDMTYKSILIPLYALPEQHNGKMVFYDQRVIDSGVNLNYKQYAGTDEHYRNFDDYSLIDNVYSFKEGYHKIDTSKKMTQKDFEKFGLDSPIERYDGLSVENSFDWKPGSLFIFDTCQVHSSTIGQIPFVTKAGLRLNFITKRDYENYL